MRAASSIDAAPVSRIATADASSSGAISTTALHDASELSQAAGPRRKDDRDAVRAEPPEDEAERVACRVVEPLDVVHQHEERLPLGRGGEEREEPGGHRERLDARQVGREHRLQRVELRGWKAPQIVL